jgi:hypothetical protein
VSTAVEVACLATSTGSRTGSLSTNVTNRRRLVTAPSAGISEKGSRKGSRKGLSSRNSRLPSGLNGYVLSECRG